MMVGPMSPRPREFAIGGASTRAISSQKMDCCIKLAPRPPYSFGHDTAAHPPSYSFRCQAFKYGKDSSIGFSRHSLQSFGTFASSHERSSSRNCFSSAVRFKSIQKTPFEPGSAPALTEEPTKFSFLCPAFTRAKLTNLTPEPFVFSVLNS